MESKILMLAIAVVFLISLGSVFVSAHAGDDEFAHHGMTEFYGMFGMGFGWIFMVLIIILLILFIIWLVKQIQDKPRRRR
ncbi:hypothetical protein D6817_00500 [Candidatus Pacearchaeota archaeon]|nr:MAG: hypothetical protein D6817_00500 [Candidatus Pacearchaeota archaeon]